MLTADGYDNLKLVAVHGRGFGRVCDCETRQLI